ncbi:Asp-tRNA(Asn)/Glu-tRNA(Gln) amidotransferase subunit GatB [Thalassoglobus sp. JC818]|uniref:Asp-tRNA(Asn)/Glu-tRNA(Gln) amidotransferase subunit GatB n=1 Tax=Thalassoglobus sp. JC818 TaxID=3232136 RepID=UPI00345B28CE
MNVTTIVGLEVHVQLQTKTKIFCGCANRFNPDAPNTQVCPVCLGHPGTLPVMNQEAFDLSLITATALNCEIAEFTKWDRKQYFYPDLPKGYQISQYDLPFSKQGWLEIDGDDGNRRKIRINRAHLEEDAGKNIHDETGRGKDSQVDLNRAGTPLLEIVSEPDLRSGAEAKQYLEEMRLLLTFLDVSDCNMQEGSLRCDANVNLHLTDDAGQTVATPIVEVKNLNSFRAVEAAIDFEVQRQLKEYEKSGRKLGDPGVEKETRGWDANRNVSFAQRGKEDAADYRYFPDPDLVPVTVTKERIAAVRAALPEAPATRRRRFEKELGLSTYDADVIVNQGRELASYFEEVVEVSGDGKQSANFVTQDVLREMKERGDEIGEFPVSASILGTIVKRVVDNKITTKSGREVFSALLEEADSDQEISTNRVDEMISERGLKVVSDTGALEEAVRSAIANCSSAVEDYRAGRKQAIGAIIGQVMKQAKGADAKAVRELIIKVIEETA